MQTITPHLWFDKEAKEAAQFYTSIFPGSRIKSSSTLHDTPSGSVDVLTIELAGQELALISAGPLFKFNPSISFLVACSTKDEADALWQRLSEGGTPLMELGEYPFGERYGWVQDRYGLSWQLLFRSGFTVGQKITPVLMFTQKQNGKAEEAIGFYTSVFPGSSIGGIFRYESGEAPGMDGNVKFSDFTLAGQHFSAMDGGQAHGFAFNEAISLIVHCDTQQQIDDYWAKLSADPKAEQCGWLKDKYGVSWQVVPAIMNEMLAGNDPARIRRVTEAFLKMKKFDIAKLKEAYEGVAEH